MIVSLNKRNDLLLYGGAQAVLIVLAIQTEGRAGWLFALPLMAALSFYAWTATFRRHRAVDDTPTSQVVSAAQGYVELTGRAENHPGLQNIAHLSQRACCWYQFRVEERDSDNKWRLVDEGESAASFVLRDASGACMIDPEGAEVLCAHKDSWTEGDRRCTEWRIHEGDTLYALGEFHTRSLAPDAAQARQDMSTLLAEWKRDQPELLRRFDLDRDGELDIKEWALARAEAKRQIERTHVELRAAPRFDCVRKPADGRLYLLSNRDPVRLARRFALWAWLHLALFFGALGAFAFLAL